MEPFDHPMTEKFKRTQFYKDATAPFVGMSEAQAAQAALSKVNALRAKHSLPPLDEIATGLPDYSRPLGGGEFPRRNFGTRLRRAWHILVNKS